MLSKKNTMEFSALSEIIEAIKNNAFADEAPDQAVQSKSIMSYFLPESKYLWK